MSYISVIERLIKNNIVDKSDIYDINKDDLRELFEKFSNFCEVNLSEAGTSDGIGDSALFFYPDYSVNGRAYASKEVKLIRVNMGTIVTLYNFFTPKIKLFTEGNLNKYKNLNENLEKLDIDVSFLLYQISTLFMFYHERAHLIQFTQQEHDFIESYENNAQAAQFSLVHHVHEFDADCEAAYHCTLHLIDYWGRFPNEMKTKENLESLLSVGMAGIISYWVFLAQKVPNLYYNQGTHPHPFIRLVYAMDIMSDTSSKNVPAEVEIDARKVLRDAVEISDILFQSINDDRLAKFGANFNTESDNIERYVNDLIKECRAFPNLVRNRRK